MTELIIDIQSDPNQRVLVYENKELKKLRALERRALQREIVSTSIQSVFGEDVRVVRDQNGVPSISGKEALGLSISHSGNWVAVQITYEGVAGIDVQEIRGNIYKGRYYFVNEVEEEMFDLTNENLLLIWCAKEALYKSKKGQIERYKESMTVKSIESNVIIADVEGEEVKCSYQMDERFILLYTTLV